MTSGNIKFLLINPWSIVNKVDRVMQLLVSNGIDIAAICETWITGANCPTTSTIKSYGYSIIHNIRGTGRGGGTALLTKLGLSMPLESQHNSPLSSIHVA